MSTKEIEDYIQLHGAKPSELPERLGRHLSDQAIIEITDNGRTWRVTLLELANALRARL
jgi:hypothetical protein